MVKHDTLPSNTAILRWRDAFLALNQERLDATRSQMTKRQQAVIDVLAVLLHVNHPRLPGFVTADTPCGVRGFTPSIAQRSALHTLARGVQLPRDPAHRSIHALYLMGSLGSVAQSSSSDLDVWVCHDELLRPQHLAALRQKCDLIEQWAAQQNCEVHFFLMNLTEFRQGQSRSADGEDCGSTQHLLLLDEFYRSA
ncbi:MAG: adenylate cyclase, partial [Thalassobium sp.]